MLTLFCVKNYKNFSELKLESLSRLNFLVGENNCGKTSLLEALLGFACGRNLSNALNFTVYRRLQFPQFNGLPAGNSTLGVGEALYNAFHDRSSQVFSFSAGLADGSSALFEHTFTPSTYLSSFIKGDVPLPAASEITTRQVPLNSPWNPGAPVMVQAQSISLGKWSVTEGGSTPELSCDLQSPITATIYPQADLKLKAMFHDATTFRTDQESSKVYSHLQRHLLMEKFITELNESFGSTGRETANRITAIENIPYPDGSVAPITVRYEDGLRLPLYALGDGLRRWYTLLGSMMTYPESLHCIDDIDAAFHPAAHGPLARNLHALSCKYHNQLFLTTHNLEFLKAALDSLSRTGSSALTDEVRVITLRRYGTEVRERTLDGRTALDLLDSDLELRV